MPRLQRSLSPEARLVSWFPGPLLLREVLRSSRPGSHLGVHRNVLPRCDNCHPWGRRLGWQRFDLPANSLHSGPKMNFQQRTPYVLRCRMTASPRPGAAESAPTAPDFDPVPLRARRDGWTPERQVAFIRALAIGGCVRDACRSVGMTRSSAYVLYRHPHAASFRRAWDEAAALGVRRRRPPLDLQGAWPRIAAGRYAMLPAAAVRPQGSRHPSTSSTMSTSGAARSRDSFLIPLPECAGGGPVAPALPGLFVRVSRTVRWRGRTRERGEIDHSPGAAPSGHSAPTAASAVSPIARPAATSEG